MLVTLPLYPPRGATRVANESHFPTWIWPGSWWLAADVKAHWRQGSTSFGVAPSYSVPQNARMPECANLAAASGRRGTGARRSTPRHPWMSPWVLQLAAWLPLVFDSGNGSRVDALVPVPKREKTPSSQRWHTLLPQLTSRTSGFVRLKTP